MEQAILFCDSMLEVSNIIDWPFNFNIEN